MSMKRLTIRDETLPAVHQILQRVDKEIEKHKRFNLLEQIHSTDEAVVDSTQDALIPLRVEVPQTENGFVYLLVSLKFRFQFCR